RDLQRQLIDLVIQDRSLVQIFRFFEQKMQCKLAFFDNKGRIQGTSANSEKLIYDWQQYIETEKDQYAMPSSSHIEKIVTKDRCLLKKDLTSTSRSSIEGCFIVEVGSEEKVSNELLQGLENLS